MSNCAHCIEGKALTSRTIDGAKIKLCQDCVVYYERKNKLPVLKINPKEPIQVH